MKTNITSVLPYLLILFAYWIGYNNGKPDPTPPEIRTDTVRVYITVRDTITIEKEKIKLVKSVPDTVYREPAGDYNGLLAQYEELSRLYFSKNTFRAEFEIPKLGKAYVENEISNNWLQNSKLYTDFKYPITTITIEKPIPSKNEFYYGGGFTASKINPISGIYGGILLKDKRASIYNVYVGYNGDAQLGFNYYKKISLR